MSNSRRARRAPTRAAWTRPSPVSGLEPEPCQIPAWLASDWPWRTKVMRRAPDSPPSEASLGRTAAQPGSRRERVTKPGAAA